MKTHLCAVGVLFFLVLVHCEIAPEVKKMLDECRQELDVSEESLKSPDFEDTKIKCFSACVMKKGDRLNEGKASIDKELDVVSKYMPDKVDDSLKEKMTECVNKANEEKDDCAVAGALFKCIFEKYGPYSP